MGRWTRIALPILLLSAVVVGADEKRKPTQQARLEAARSVGAKADDKKGADKKGADKKATDKKAADKRAERKRKLQLEALKLLSKKVLALKAKADAGQARRRFQAIGRNVSIEVDRRDAGQTALVLTPVGPLVVEFNVFVDGKPFRELQEALVDTMLRDADVDKNGKSLWSEALGNPRFAFGRLSYVRNKAQMRSIQRMYDVDRNQVVDRHEARAMLANYFGFNTLFISYAPAPQGRGASARSIIDEDEDLRISRKEWLAATDRLKSRDADDNDVLERGELGGARNTNIYAAPLPVAYGSRGTPTMTRVYMLDAPKDQHVYIYRALDKHYKIHKKESLQRPLVKAFIQLMDKNGNGQLNLDEMVHLAELKPQLSIEVNLGKNGKKKGFVLKKVADDVKLKQKAGFASDRPIELSFVGMKMAVQGINSSIQGRYAGTGKAIVRQLDKNKNNYVEKKEADGSQYARLFESFDMDGDGKAYAKEIAEYYDRSQRPMYDRVAVTLREENNAVFSVLDRNGDGRLGLREIRGAGKALAALDKNKDGVISAVELPQTVSCVVARGPNYGSYSIQSDVRRGSSYGRVSGPRRQRGPNWFVRMDRNADGDVSRREFPGDKVQFDKLDKNGDDFIDPQEAAAAGSR